MYYLYVIDHVEHIGPIKVCVGSNPYADIEALEGDYELVFVVPFTEKMDAVDAQFDVVEAFLERRVRSSWLDIGTAAVSDFLREHLGLTVVYPQMATVTQPF
jgi:hypothetical protein